LAARHGIAANTSEADADSPLFRIENDYVPILELAMKFPFAERCAHAEPQ
jgi:hypothetical protein